MMKSMLLVDDEVRLLRILGSTLKKKGYIVYLAANKTEAYEIIENKVVDVILLDLMLPDTTGLELLQELVPLHPHKAFIVMTAYGNVETAVSAMKNGAFDYIEKPSKLDEILIVVERAIKWLRMKEENIQLKEKLKQLDSNFAFVGDSPAIKPIYQLVERVANTDATILLTGESGTGKSRIARMIHELSERIKQPFVSVNCASIPDQLLESELFGYEKGAFTGANVSRKGKFEAADGGTVFLDEIGEISVSLQAKLLQVTQEKTFMRLGSNETKRMDIRIISATNRDLKKMVEEGSFREDLYYRLNIVDIYIPPLRERKDDIHLLVQEFLAKHRKRYSKNYYITPELMESLVKYNWPGNVRELENAVERAVILCLNEELSIDDFPAKIREKNQDRSGKNCYTFDSLKTLSEQIDNIEQSFIIQALKESHGNAAEAARTLGISRQNLLYKMNKYASSLLPHS